MIDVSQKDIERLRRRMNDLAYAKASRASRNAINAGLRVLANAIRPAVPVGKTGKLRRSVGQRLTKGKRGLRGVTTAKAGLNVGKGRPVVKGSSDRRPDYAPHAHFPTLGTQPRWAGVNYGYDRKRGQRSKYNPKKDTFSHKYLFNAKSKLAYRGFVTPDDFVKRASQAAEPAAIAAVRSRLLLEIEREVARK